MKETQGHTKGGKASIRERSGGRTDVVKQHEKRKTYLKWVQCSLCAAKPRGKAHFKDTKLPPHVALNLENFFHHPTIPICYTVALIKTGC